MKEFGSYCEICGEEPSGEHEDSRLHIIYSEEYRDVICICEYCERENDIDIGREHT